MPVAIGCGSRSRSSRPVADDGSDAANRKCGRVARLREGTSGRASPVRRAAGNGGGPGRMAEGRPGPGGGGAAGDPWRRRSPAPGIWARRGRRRGPGRYPGGGHRGLGGVNRGRVGTDVARSPVAVVCAGPPRRCSIWRSRWSGWSRSRCRCRPFRLRSSCPGHPPWGAGGCGGGGDRASPRGCWPRLRSCPTSGPLRLTLSWWPTTRPSRGAVRRPWLMGELGERVRSPAQATAIVRPFPTSPTGVTCPVLVDWSLAVTEEGS